MTRLVGVFLALAFWPALPASAQSPPDAARELARKIAAAVQGAAAISFRNQSSLPGAAFDELRGALEAELRAAGVRQAEGAGAAVRITASENRDSWLLVAEAVRGQDRTVAIAAWPRAAVAEPMPRGITLEKKRILAQDEPMLDFALTEAAGANLLLVLEPSRVVVYTASGGRWEQRNAFPVAMPGPPPRDLRGRLTVTANSFQAYLPGVACRGTLDPAALDCKPGELLWPLTSGASFAGLAAFQPGRNTFDGTVLSPSGARVAVPPFFSAALAGTTAEPVWVFALPDGRTSVHNAALAAAEQQYIPGWGGDIAGAEARCGGGRQVLATAADNDAEVQAWDVSGGKAAPVSAAIDLSGVVTALWPAGPASVSAVVWEPDTGRYAAYALAIGCGS